MDMRSYQPEEIVRVIDKMLGRDHQAWVKVKEKGVEKELILNDVERVVVLMNGKPMALETLFQYLIENMEILELDTIDVVIKQVVDSLQRGEVVEMDCHVRGKKMVYAGVKDTQQALYHWGERNPNLLSLPTCSVEEIESNLRELLPHLQAVRYLQQAIS